MAERPLGPGPVYRLGEVEVDVGRATVSRQGQNLHLRKKAFDVLLLLISRRGEVVTKRELTDACWSDTAVTDDAIVQCIGDIRRVLEDDAQEPRYVLTVKKVGYRLVADVAQLSAGGDAETRPDAPSRWRRRGWVIAVAAAVVVIVATFVWRSELAATPPAPVAALVPHAVFVAPFDNPAKSAEWSWLRFGLPDMLMTSLAQTAGTSVLGRAQQERIASTRGWSDQPIDLNEMIDAARSARSGLLVTGSFAVVGDELRIDTQVYDVADGRLLGGDATVVADRARLLSDVNIVIAKVAARLGATPPPRTVPDVMTDDLDAYRAYSLAVDRDTHLRPDEALDLLKSAVKRDPKFAMAYARIGYSLGVVQSEVTAARPYLEQAFKLSDRLTDRDRRLIVAWDAIVRSDFSAAIDAYQEIVRLDPFDAEAYARLTSLYVGEERFEEARAAGERGVAVDARNPAMYNALASVYLALNRLPDAVSAARRYVDLAPAEPNARDTLGLVLLEMGQYSAAAAEYLKALQLRPTFEVARVHLGNVYVRLGRYRDAEREYHAYIDHATGTIDRSRGWSYLAFLAKWRNRPAEAAEAAERAKAIDPGSSARMLTDLARPGSGHAQDALKAYPTVWNTRGMRGDSRFDLFARGMAALESGGADQALSIFRELQTKPHLTWHIQDFENALADAYLALHRPDDAIAEYRRILAHTPSYPLAHYQLARAYDAKGDHVTAVREYREFLATWSEADRDLPTITEAARHVTTSGVVSR